MQRIAGPSRRRPNPRYALTTLIGRAQGWLAPRNRTERLRRGRERGERLAARYQPPADVMVRADQLGGVRAEYIEVPGAEDATVMYLHGGAYVSGSLATIRPFAVDLARAARVRVVTVDYRLAPEHPFPAGLDDATEAWRALSQRHAAEPLALAGDSAGGGLAIALAVRLRDLGARGPAVAAVLSPWTDLSSTGATRTGPPAWRDWMLDRRQLDLSARDYAGQDLQHPLVSPRYADLRGLPPLLVTAGTHELLLDDAVHLAQAADVAGVDVTLEIARGMPHVWQLLGAVLPEARLGIATIARFLRRGLGLDEP